MRRDSSGTQAAPPALTSQAIAPAGPRAARLPGRDAAGDLGGPDRAAVPSTGHHPEAPEEFHRQQGEQHPGAAHEPECLSTMRGLAHRREHRRGAAAGAGFGQERQQGDQIDPVAAPAAGSRGSVKALTGPSSRGDQTAAEQRAEGDRQSEDRAAVTQAAFVLGVGVGGEGGVDVPGLQRSSRCRVRGRRPATPEGRGEQCEGVRDDEERQRREVDRRGGDQDRFAAEGVGEPTGGKFEGEHDKALHGDRHAGSGQGQPALLHQQDAHRDQQAAGEPAQGVQDQVAVRIRRTVRALIALARCGGRGPRRQSPARASGPQGCSRR